MSFNSVCNHILMIKHCGHLILLITCVIIQTKLDSMHLVLLQLLYNYYIISLGYTGFKINNSVMNVSSMSNWRESLERRPGC